jgi:hypothetical protein
LSRKKSGRLPTFATNEDWYGIKVSKTHKGSLTEQIDYKTQYNSVYKAFDACNINSIKKTHVGRGCVVPDMLKLLVLLKINCVVIADGMHKVWKTAT